MVMVTDIETQSAMSSVHFRQGWHQRIKHRISTILHTVRPHRSTRSFGQTSDEKFGSDSAPHIWGDRGKQDAKHHGSERRKKDKKEDHKDKGKGIAIPDKGTLFVPEGPDYVNHSPETGSPTSSRIGDDHLLGKKQWSNDRTLGRFFHPFAERWRPHKTPSHGSTPPNASTSTLSSSAESYTLKRGHAGGRSTEAVSNRTGRYSPIRFAQRASSVPTLADMEDVMSINSGWDDDPLEWDAIMLGAGGVANGPVYGTSTPSSLTAAAAAASNVPSTSSHPQPDHLLIGNSIPTTADPTLYDTTFTRQAQIRSQAASPLVHVAYGSDVEHENTYDEGSDDSHSYGEVVEGRYQGSPYPDVPSATSSEIYGEDEGEDSDDENVPIEVRRRRPSVAVTTASPSPPSNGSPL